MRSRSLVAGLVSVIAAAASAQTSDLVADWNQGANPNGAWSYREGSNLLGSVPSWDGLGQPAYATVANGPGHIPAALKLTSIPAGFDTQAGDVLMHCRDNTNGGANGEGSIVWTAPQAGFVNVSGHVWIARDIGRSVNWILSVNGTAITSGTVASGDPYSRANPFPMSAGPGGPGVLQSIPVNSGDTIGFLALKGAASPHGDFICVVWTIVYAPPTASAVAVGTGCGTAPNVPALAMTPPVIGLPTTISLTNGTPGAAGSIYFSAIPAAPTPVGAGCTAWLDIPTFALLFPVATNGSGAWSTIVVIPTSPPLAGVQVALQGILIPTAGPLGFDLTNGVYALIGY